LNKNLNSKKLFKKKRRGFLEKSKKDENQWDLPDENKSPDKIERKRFASYNAIIPTDFNIRRKLNEKKKNKLGPIRENFDLKDNDKDPIVSKGNKKQHLVNKSIRRQTQVPGRSNFNSFESKLNPTSNLGKGDNKLSKKKNSKFNSPDK